MRKLTYDEVVLINRRIGEDGTVQNSNLEFVMDMAKDIDGVVEHATTLLYEIPRAHSFTNGNKRTAFYAFATFLKLNWYVLRREPRFNDKMARVINDIATGKARRLKVERMIRHMVKR